MKHVLIPLALTTALTAPAWADDVVMRHMPSHGGVSAHDLAQELGYFENTGIVLESAGHPRAGRNR